MRRIIYAKFICNSITEYKSIDNDPSYGFEFSSISNDSDENKKLFTETQLEFPYVFKLKSSKKDSFEVGKEYYFNFIPEH